MNEQWTQDDYAEYKRQIALINNAYGNGIPTERVESIAADIVNKKRGYERKPE